MSLEQLKDYINLIPCDKKAILKENFYKQKIEEAKNKKRTTVYYKGKKFRFVFEWNKLPEEVQALIINFKEQMDVDYISEEVSSNHLTHKSLKEYLFREYKNEIGIGLEKLPAINWNFEKFIWIMINKKSCLEHYYSMNIGSNSYPATARDMLEITKNKSPSLKEYTIFRNKQRKKKSELRKTKKKIDTDYDSKFKIGDIVESKKNRWDDPTAFVIRGETKTQYRVEKIEWSKEQFISDGTPDGAGVAYWGLYLDPGRVWNTSKHKNIGKKMLIEKLETSSVNHPFNEKMYYTTKWCGGS